MGQLHFFLMYSLLVSNQKICHYTPSHERETKDKIAAKKDLAEGQLNLTPPNYSNVSGITNAVKIRLTLTKVGAAADEKPLVSEYPIESQIVELLNEGKYSLVAEILGKDGKSVIESGKADSHPGL